MRPLQRLVASAGVSAMLSEHERRRAFDWSMARGEPREHAKLLASWSWSLAQWHRAGANVFTCTDSLTASLLLTEVRGNGWPPIARMPFMSLLVQVPEGLLRNRHSWTRYVLATVTRGHVFAYVTRSLGLEEEGSNLGFNDHDSFDTFHWWPIGDAPAPRVVEVPGIPSDDIALVHRGGALVRRLLVGLCSWLASLDPSHGAAKACASGAHRQVPVAAPNVIVIGNEIKLSRDMREAARDLGLASQGSPSPGWKLRFKHVVRGHWRNQAVGAGRTDHRMTWIAPYWKGPDGTAAWAHIYKDKPE